MSEKAPIPSAEEMRQEHAEGAAAAEYLNQMATNERGTTFATSASERPSPHEVVPGYVTAKHDEEYSVSAPAKAQPYLEKAAQEAQAALDKNDIAAGKIVTKHQDKFETQAREDMVADVTKQHQRNLEDVEGYKRTKDMFPEQYDAAIARTKEYIDKHADVLGEKPKAA